MRTCEKCGNPFPTTVRIDDKIRNLGNRRYCLSCSPFGQHNTKTLKDPVFGNCKECGRDFEYDRKQGHRKKVCNSCCVIKSQRKKKAFAVAFYGGICTKCGYCKCYDALEFHHLGGKDERPSYVIMRWSWERAKVELDKCQLVCSNCHREIHAEMRVRGRQAMHLPLKETNVGSLPTGPI